MDDPFLGRKPTIYNEKLPSATKIDMIKTHPFQNLTSRWTNVGHFVYNLVVLSYSMHTECLKTISLKTKSFGLNRGFSFIGCLHSAYSMMKLQPNPRLKTKDPNIENNDDSNYRAHMRSHMKHNPRQRHNNVNSHIVLSLATL